MKRFIILFLILLLLLAQCSDDGTAEDDFRGEPLSASHWFQRITDGTREDGIHVSAKDGAVVVLKKEFSAGIPYAHEEIVFDPAYFAAEEELENPAFSGASHYEWHFTPLRSGETEIMMVSRYLVDDSLECMMYHVIIDEALNCRIDWYETGNVGENYILIPN